MRDSVGSIHLEVKSYLVEPLSLNGFSPHASPRAATHTRHARTNKELVSLAKRRHKKTPATLRLPGRRLSKVEFKLREWWSPIFAEPSGDFGYPSWDISMIIVD